MAYGYGSYDWEDVSENDGVSYGGKHDKYKLALQKLTSAYIKSGGDAHHVGRQLRETANSIDPLTVNKANMFIVQSTDAIRDMYIVIKILKDDYAENNPKVFKILIEGPLAEIERIQSELNSYVVEDGR